jgi:opacity protein-like surface antigen
LPTRWLLPTRKESFTALPGSAAPHEPPSLGHRLPSSTVYPRHTMKSTARIAPVLMVLILVPLCAAAQTPHIEVAPVYSQASRIFGPTCHGGGAAVGVSFNRWVGITADVQGCRSRGTGGLFGTSPSTTETRFTYLAGPRFSYRALWRFTPYAQALLGGAHFSRNGTTGNAGGNAFSMSTGAGLDLGLSRRVTLRLIQPEFLYTRFGNSSDNQVRIQTGIVFKIGERP